jgi:hypothetical protein
VFRVCTIPGLRIDFWSRDIANKKSQCALDRKNDMGINISKEGGGSSCGSSIRESVFIWTVDPAG